jgi:phenylacetate-CoA ligase
MRLFIRPTYYLYQLIRNLYIKKKELEKIQLSSLKKVVKNAYETVPYYNKIFKENGFGPEKIKTLNDINKIPIITKDQIRDNINDLISTTFDKEHLIRYSTSGSTGKPLPIYLNRQEDDYRKAKHLRSSTIVGHRPWHKYAVITSPTHFNDVPPILRRLGIFSRDFISVFETVETQIGELEKLQPDILDGYSSSLYLLAKEVTHRESINFKPKFILGGAELSDEPQRKFIENTLNAPFYDRYATVEFERMSWQCKERKEYHIDADAMILQFVDENGEQVSPGERGEIICTSLFNYTMPLLRYNIGDIGVPSENECECGITLPTMELIEGRKDSMLTMPDGRMISPRSFNIAVNYFEYINKIRQFKVVQKKIDLFEIWIELIDKSLKDSHLIEKLDNHMRKMLNIKDDVITFKINIVENMPKHKTGKSRAIVSEVVS